MYIIMGQLWPQMAMILGYHIKIPNKDSSKQYSNWIHPPMPIKSSIGCLTVYICIYDILYYIILLLYIWYLHSHKNSNMTEILLQAYIK